MPNITCKHCKKFVAICLCNPDNGLFTAEPYVRPAKAKASVSSKNFNTYYYKLLATQPLHSPSDWVANVNGYFRSSSMGAMGKFASVPVLPGARQYGVIGSRHNTTALDGLAFSHVGSSVHVTQMNDIFLKKARGESYTGELMFNLHGQHFPKGTLCNNIHKNTGHKCLDELKEHQSSKEINIRDEITPIKKATINEKNGVLTDIKLKDNNESCEAIFEKVKDLKYLKIEHKNKYPCLGVLIATPANLVEYTEQWMLFIMSIFLGICDYEFHNGNSRVKLWVKTSFGHMETTIADCYHIMRLNVGLLTGGMQTDLATRLIELNDCLAQLYKHAKVSTKDNTFTVDYMAPLSLFTLEENEKTGMMKPNTCHVDGLSKNNSYYYGYAFRYINLRLKYKANLQLKNKPNILGMILENNKPLEPTLKNVPEMYTTIMAKKNLDLIEKIKKIYSADLSKIDHNLSYYPTVIQSLRFCLGAWVYNKYIATQGELEDDGYGSSSEEEHKITNVTIHAKKIAVPFGMRAIAIAHFLQQYLLDQKCTKIVFDQMYYETAELKPTYLVPEKLKKVKRNHEMSFIDGNHFPNSFLARTKPLNLDDTYVVDVTSAGTEQMGEIVYKHIVFLKREFVILVNSMTKNGFAGSDTVGIGMLRIFSNQKEMPKSAKLIIEELAQSKASGYANMMRRGYKIEFGGQQNSGILSAASKNTLKQNKTLLGKRNPDSLEKVPSNKKTVCKKALLQKKYT